MSNWLPSLHRLFIGHMVSSVAVVHTLQQVLHGVFYDCVRVGEQLMRCVAVFPGNDVDVLVEICCYAAISRILPDASAFAPISM